MATKKVIDMTARSSSALAYDDYLYLTGESPNIDEKMQASVLRDYTLQGVKTSANSGLAQTSTPYATSNPNRELSLDVDNLTAAGGGTASVTDYIAIEQGAGTKKLLVGDLPFSSSASSVSSITGGDGITASASTGAVTLSADLKVNGGIVIESAELAIDLAASSITGTLADGDIASAATWNAKQAALTFGIADTNSVVIDSASVADNDYAKFTASGLEGRNASETKTDLSLDNVENTALSTWTGSTNITSLGTIATGTWEGTDIAAGYLADTAVTPGSYTSAAITIDQQGRITAASSGSPGDLTEVQATAPILVTNGTGPVPTISADIGIADDKLVAIDSASVADNDYAKFTANGLEGRTASEVKTDLSLDNVENTALSTWAGSTNITTLGTVATGTWNATALGDSYISSAATWNAKQNALTFGIADTNSVVIDSASVADNDYAKFTASGLEGRTASETKTDLSLDNVENTALSTWTGSTNVTTLGTIATGTWQGTDIAAGYIADTAVTPGSYTLSSITVDQQGRITAASSGSATGDPAGTAVAMAIALGG